ncbi:DoxX family protein [Pseudomonas sp. GD03860]|uniref:MauE/DoxX family redox-associated membrane protein n=1 Tax=Pseudomonas TaxID=286 RepID=UPI002364694D|nr:MULTISPECIES: MauE/DoxX family redox-associated membrane protein [Pseudomonas]MDD2058465.1 DoxX family protein [Pseudomonas putida]MDH0640434.1 DoxX family protein [Pseudomonas sp. GD03860]
MQLDPILVFASSLAMTVILANAATHKFRSPRWFVAQVADYGLLSESMVKPFARLLPLFEMAVALGLLVPQTRLIAALLAALLMAIYATAIGVNLWRGRRDIDCGCAGPGQMQPLRPVLLLRSALLIALSLLAAAEPQARSIGHFDSVVIISSAAVTLLLYVAADGLMANAPRLLKLIGR